MVQEWKYLQSQWTDLEVGDLGADLQQEDFDAVFGGGACNDMLQASVSVENAPLEDWDLSRYL